MACNPCNDPETGALDGAEAASFDIAAGLIWALQPWRTQRPTQGEEVFDVLAQGIQRALCFLKTEF